MGDAAEERLLPVLERIADALERLAVGNQPVAAPSPQSPRPRRAKSAAEAARLAAEQLEGGKVDDLARIRAHKALKRSGYR